jgi:hypothetical protein
LRQRVSAGAPCASVIIPTYQRRDYVKRAVESVLAQTYPDFELIVVDDGSTDGTGAALAALDPRLRYHRQPHRGVAAARNAGLRLARGEIVAFLDSDDRWLSHHLEVVTEALARHPAAVLVCTCPGLHVAGRQKARDACLVDALPHMLGTLGLVGYTPCIAVRRHALLEVGGFNERLPVAEDHELWLRLSARGPFSLVQRRTIARQTTRGSLIERGIRGGHYRHAFETIASSAISEVERRPLDGRPDVTRRAQGSLHYARALQALARQDDRAVRVALEEACARLPELSRQPEQVAHRITRMGHEPAVRVRHFATAAALWPDPRSDTALFLRAKAIVLALRARRPVAALRLLANCPPHVALRFLIRNVPLWLRVARRVVEARVYRGKETAELWDPGERG